MNVQLIKQWLEALENSSNIVFVDTSKGPMRNDAIKSLRQAIEQAEKQEPLAWRVRWTDGSVSYRDQEPSEACQKECEVQPLYTTPQPQQAEKQEPVAHRYCCHSCFKASGGVMLDRMILCPECGNKRCPKASDHSFSCAGSNEPGQIGSIYSVSATVFVQEPATDEEMKRAKPVCADFFSFRAGVRYAESKFKEKRS